MIIICSFCKIEVDKPIGQVNRTLNLGRKLYCSHACHIKSKELIQPCDYCRNTFKTTISVIKHKKIKGQEKFFCSVKCRALYNKIHSKECLLCKTYKNRSQFREHKDVKNGKDYYYISDKCKECEKKAAKEYYHRMKHDVEWVQRQSASRKENYWNNREKFRSQSKRNRETEKAKETRKRYNELNKYKILSDHRIKTNEYSKKITDGYARWQLMTKGNNNPSPEEIEIQKVKILIRRIKVKVNQKSKKDEK